MNKLKCYECKYRGTIPGDAHSCCNHPTVSEKDDNEFGALVQMLEGKFNDAAKKLEIKGHLQGIKNGWFNWPANFNPTWLINCNGFVQKEKKS